MADPTIRQGNIGGVQGHQTPGVDRSNKGSIAKKSHADSARAAQNAGFAQTEQAKSLPWAALAQQPIPLPNADIEHPEAWSASALSDAQAESRMAQTHFKHVEHLNPIEEPQAFAETLLQKMHAPDEQGLEALQALQQTQTHAPKGIEGEHVAATMLAKTLAVSGAANVHQLLASFNDAMRSSSQLFARATTNAQQVASFIRR